MIIIYCKYARITTNILYETTKNIRNKRGIKTMYNYLENVKEDVINEIDYNYTKEEIKEHLDNAYNRQNWEQTLYDDLFVNDSVTGNASGSYYCNAYKAGESLNGNWDLLREALYGFGEQDVNPIEKGEEWCDVTIRCYLLSQAISLALDELEEELED